MAGAEGLEVAPQKHSRIARLERFALLLVSSPHRRAFLRRRRRRNGSPRHAPRASVSYNSIRIKQKRHPKVSFCFGRGRRLDDARHAVLERLLYILLCVIVFYAVL